MIVLCFTYELGNQGMIKLTTPKGEVHVDYMIKNILQSIPSKPQKDNAVAVRKVFEDAHDKRLADTMSLHLRLGYGEVGYQRLAYSWNATTKEWELVYFVLCGVTVKCWESCAAALSNKAPLFTLTVTKPVQQHNPKTESNLLDALVPNMVSKLPSKALLVLTIPALPQSGYFAVHTSTTTPNHPIIDCINQGLDQDKLLRSKRAASRSGKGLLSPPETPKSGKEDQVTNPLVTPDGSEDGDDASSPARRPSMQDTAKAIARARADSGAQARSRAWSGSN